VQKPGPPTDKKRTFHVFVAAKVCAFCPVIPGLSLPERLFYTPDDFARQRIVRQFERIAALVQR
jgi:hypothetical protein